MNISAERPDTPWHVWAVGIVSLLWNAVGAVDYTMTQTRNMDYLAGFTPEQLDYMFNFPAWANAMWALGVWGALLGSVLILLRSRWSVTAFIVSLVGVLGTTVFQFGMPDVPEMFKTTGAIVLSVAIWVSIILLLYYAIRMRARGIFR